MKKPNFSAINPAKSEIKGTVEAWKKEAEKAVGKNIEDLLFETNEQIKIKPLYVEEDNRDLEHMESVLRHRSFYKRAVSFDVCQSSLDGTSVCRFFDCRGIQCVLQA